MKVKDAMTGKLTIASLIRIWVPQLNSCGLGTADSFLSWGRMARLSAWSRTGTFA
jgi:hypothetical protein